jgi:hypothetical protein
VNPSRFAAQLLNQIFVVQLLFTCVHVARPACGHRNSSLLARLHQS